jgi:hypothetical protein
MKAKDPLDAAIDAVEAAAVDAPEPITLDQANLVLNSSGRPLIVAFPPDMSETEILDLMAWASVTLAAIMRTRRAAAAKPKIEIVRSMPGRPS